MRIPDHLMQSLENALPPSAEVQATIREYLQVAQLNVPQLAARAGYSTGAINMFLNDRYTLVSKSDVMIRKALVDFIAAHPVTISTESCGRLHETGNVRVMRKWFTRCLERREMAGVYGPPGAQKTFVFSHLVAEHNQREISKNGHGTRAYLVYCSESVTPRQLLLKMVRAAAIHSSVTMLALMDNLRFHLGKRKSIFVLDEAQHLSIPCLEIIRELNDLPPHCGILLSGSHRLFQMFHQRAAELEQWNSRISNFVALPGIAVAEAVEIVEAELGQLPTDELKRLLENCLVLDGYSKSKHKYYSARRLFRQIADIKADPRFNNPPMPTAPTGDAQ